MNNRYPLIPSISGLYSDNLNPTILSSSQQHVSFSVVMHNQLIHISVVYASTSHVVRRSLWMELASLQQSYPGPWCFFFLEILMPSWEHMKREEEGFQM